MKILFLSAIFATFLFAAPVFAEVNITAPIAVVMDFDTGEILYDRNMEQRWIPASMTKSMTAFIVYQEIEAGNLTLETQLRVSANAAAFSSDRRVAGSFVPLPRDTYISVETLLRLMMLPSANAAAVVFAEHISGNEDAFVARMNETAFELGMYAEFNNSHGARINHTNAYSVAVLVREFIQRYPDILRITAMPTVVFNGHTYNNTNHLLTTRPFEGTDGFKTGSLRQAGWNHSTTAVRDGRRVIAVVMNAANNAARQNYSRTLLDFGFAEIARREAEAVSRIRVFFDDTLFSLALPPVIELGEVMLPLRSIFEPLGYDISWNNEHRIASASAENSEIALFLDRRVAYINGRVITLVAPARIINSSVYVSLEFIAAATGTTVSYDTRTGVIQFIS